MMCNFLYFYYSEIMWQKHCTYSSIALLSAYKAVKEQKVAIRAAARNFGIPESTLHDST